MNSFHEFIMEHRFFALIGVVVVVAFILTSISMTLYVTSGASSLDLSRPGYVQARSQVKDDTVSKSFPSTGTLTKKDYDQYGTLFDKQLETISKLSSYDQAPIDDAALHLTDRVQTSE